MRWERERRLLRRKFLLFLVRLPCGNLWPVGGWRPGGCHQGCTTSFLPSPCGGTPLITRPRRLRLRLEEKKANKFWFCVFWPAAQEDSFHFFVVAGWCT
uniref:Putative secreted protein n=1 Tax=Anopheles triannulatus TaxID=58253 RepID=A0A2M4B3Q6_9DIPT